MSLTLHTHQGSGGDEAGEMNGDDMFGEGFEDAFGSDEDSDVVMTPMPTAGAGGGHSVQVRGAGSPKGLAHSPG